MSKILDLMQAERIPYTVAQARVRGAEERDRVWMTALRMAVDAECTCGGGEPAHCCPACGVWHRLKKMEG